jgi:hypothetical protein
MENVSVLSLGVININTGNTKYDFSIYENNTSGDGITYLTNQGFLLISAGNVRFDEVFNLRNDQTLRTITRGVTIVDSCKTNREEVLAMLKKHGYDYYPTKAFKAKSKNNKKLTTSYTLK